MRNVSIPGTGRTGLKYQPGAVFPFVGDRDGELGGVVDTAGRMAEVWRQSHTTMKNSRWIARL